MTISASNRLSCSAALAPTAERLVEQLSDSSSLWYTLKLAEMSGYDYVFAPEEVCRQLRSLSALEEFLVNVQTLLGAQGQRTVLIGYYCDHLEQLHFDRYRIEHAEGIAIDWHRDSLDGSPQRDFVELLFHHSEHLIPPG